MILIKADSQMASQGTSPVLIYHDIETGSAPPGQAPLCVDVHFSIKEERERTRTMRGIAREL